MTKLTKQLSYSGLMAALCFISTAFISFPVPFTSGYIHLGDALVLSSGVILGKKYGAFAAGIGSALADIVLGYASWALPTFIIKALMAFIIGYIFEDEKNKKKLLFLSGIYLTIWIGFIFILRSLIASDHILDQSEALITGEVVTNTNDIISLATTTQNILIASGLLIPLIVVITLLFSNKKETIGQMLNRAAAFIVAGSVMVILYYMTYGLLYGNWVVPIFSVPANLIQYGAGVFIGILLLPLSQRFSLIESKA